MPLRKFQDSQYIGALEWPREDVEASVLHDFIP